MNMITSKENELIKHIRSLSQKKYRDEYKEYIVEGIKMVKESIKYATVKCIIVCEKLFDDSKDIDTLKKANIRLEFVSKTVFDTITDTKTPQGVLAVVEQTIHEKINIKALEKDKTIFALDNIQDPGNLGTIIRTLDSAGFKNLIVSQDTVDVYNPKVVRSTMGAIFRINIFCVSSELIDTLNSLKSDGYKIIITSLEAKNYIYDIDFNERGIIVIGNESKGVSSGIQSIADEKYKIPMIGKTESLNAAVATSIIAYEKVRRLVK